MTLLLLLVACTGSGTDSGDTGEPLGPPPERVDPNEAGPYAAGFVSIELEDPRGGELKVQVWYPAVDPGTEPDAYEEVSITVGGFREAVPDRRGAPYPLVAFSHGFGGIRFQNASMSEHLASHGFVVVAPDHRNNNMFDLKSSLTGTVLVERPGEISRAVDGLLAHPAYGDLADSSQFVMSGHSFGGLTSLVVGGGALDLEGGVEFCAENDRMGCRFFEDTELGDVSEAKPDPRAVALIDISPGGVYAFGSDGLSGVVPSLSIGGDGDVDLPYDSEARPVMDALPTPKILVTLANVGHWSVSDMCLVVPFLVDCSGAEDGWAEPEDTSLRVRTLVTAFAGRHLLGDARYDAFLTQDAYDVEAVLVE